MKLSLCIATFNEEKNIHHPLDSAYDLVDEVVIVDGGSTDKTVEVAKSYGKKVRIINSDNPLMFHKNKQKALDATKGEWILQLDADEAITDELKKEIKNATGVPSQGSHQRAEFFQPVAGSSTGGKDEGQAQSQTTVAFWLPRKNFFLTRFLLKGGQYPDYTIRLYRNGYARFACQSVHENVTIDTSIVIPSERSESRDPNNKMDFSTLKYIARNDRRLIGYLKNPILHYADPTFSRYLKRWDRYTSLEAVHLAKKINLQSSIFYLLLMFIDYFIVKPSYWFFLTYFRHLGFLDGFPGFVFAAFSSLRFWVIYIKVWHMQRGR